MAKSKLITCPTCGEQIAASAKVCPKCGAKIKKPIYKKWWFWVIVVILVIGLFGGKSSSNSSTKSTSASDATKTTENVETEDNQEEVVEITYTTVTVDDMMDTLDDNAMKAENTYNDAYLEIKGRLGVIDSDGKYISLYPINNKYAFQGVQCFIKNDDQKNAVMEMSKDDTITVKVQITEVGEVLGYQANIIEFVQE